MSRARVDPAAIAGAVIWAAGTWCAAGAIAPGGGGGRIGVLAPLWALLPLIAAAIAVVLVRRPTGRQATAFWLPALSALPWLPITLPPAVLLAVGPGGLSLAAACFAAVAIPPRGIAVHGRVGVVAAAVAIAFVAAAWWIGPRIPGGDEPHYLIITQSLLHDGDLRIEDNHRRREYAAYVEGELRPDYLRRGTDGAIYSIHAPGTSAIVLPAFAVGGYRAVVVFLGALSALALVVVWRTAEELSGSRDAAMFGAGAVCLSVPFFFQAFTVYPDGLAAIAVTTVIWLALARRGPPSWRAALWCGILLGLLPWLHTRYLAIAGPLGLVVAGRIIWPEPPDEFRPRWNSLAALATPAAVALIAWLGMFNAIYGVWDPRAAYGHATDMRLVRIPHGLSGLLFDQQFGLLPNAPVFVLALAGMGTLFRYRRRLAVELAVISVPYVLAVAAFHMWWGGRSSPARFLVPVLLPLAIPMSAWWATRSTRTARAVGLVLLVGSLALTAAFVLVDRGAFIYNTRDGHALWLLGAARAVNLTFALPSLFQSGPPLAWSLAAAWALAGVGGWLLLRRVELGGVSYGPWRAATLAAAALAIAVGSTSGWALTSVPPIDEGRAALQVLGRGCRQGATAVGGTRAVTLTGMRIPDASRRTEPRRMLRWSGVDVPPGRYAIALASSVNVSGALEVALGRPDTVLSRCALSDQRPGVTPCEISLPAGAAALWITGDDDAARSADGVVLTVQSLGSPDLCDARALRAMVYDGGTWFLTGGRAWVERGGLWVAGADRVEIVGDAEGAPMRLRIRQGAASGTVQVRAGGWSDVRRLPAGETWDVDVPGSGDRRPQRVTVATDSSFQPSDHDVNSADTRRLGVWLEPR